MRIKANYTNIFYLNIIKNQKHFTIFAAFTLDIMNI